jgi:hypothetical protein
MSTSHNLTLTGLGTLTKRLRGAATGHARCTRSAGAAAGGPRKRGVDGCLGGARRNSRRPALLGAWRRGRVSTAEDAGAMPGSRRRARAAPAHVSLAVAAAAAAAAALSLRLRLQGEGPAGGRCGLRAARDVENPGSCNGRVRPCFSPLSLLRPVALGTSTATPGGPRRRTPAGPPPRSPRPTCGAAGRKAHKPGPRTPAARPPVPLVFESRAGPERRRTDARPLGPSYAYSVLSRARGGPAGRWTLRSKAPAGVVALLAYVPGYAEGGTVCRVAPLRQES